MSYTNAGKTIPPCFPAIFFGLRSREMEMAITPIVGEPDVSIIKYI